MNKHNTNTVIIVEHNTFCCFKAGDSSFDKIKKSNQIRNEKDDEADLKHQKEVGKVTSLYERNKKNLNLKMRARVEKSLRDGDPETATAQLAKFLGADNFISMIY